MLRLRSPHPFSSTPTAGRSGTGVFDAKLCEKGALAGREPPPPNEGAVTPGPSCQSALFIQSFAQEPSLIRSIVSVTVSH